MYYSMECARELTHTHTYIYAIRWSSNGIYIYVYIYTCMYILIQIKFDGVCAGAYHSCGIIETFPDRGKVDCWGNNEYGQVFKFEFFYCIFICVWILWIV